MEAQRTLTKVELLRAIKRFIADKNRGISIDLFANAAGIHPRHFLDVFKYEKHTLTRTTQIRVSKVYQSWKNGEMRVMERPDMSRYVEYKKEPAPVIRKSNQLVLTTDGIKLKLGLRNRLDYSEETLDEQLNRRM